MERVFSCTVQPKLSSDRVNFLIPVALTRAAAARDSIRTRERRAMQRMKNIEGCSTKIREVTGA